MCKSFPDNLNFRLQTGVGHKLKHKGNPKDHWLDHAVGKYGEDLVRDTKKLLNVLVIYLPLPIFWALQAQQGSRWVFQATKMDGDIGFYTVKPDQMIFLNSFIGILLIPVFEYAFYPLMSCIGFKNPLPKMILGVFMTGAGFVLAALLEQRIETNAVVLSMLWMVPQYFLLCMGEILVYTANLNFSYTEAPASMKSVILGCSYFSVAGGSFIVILISGMSLFQSQVHEFLFFASIAFADLLIFCWLATRYKYAESEKLQPEV